MIPETGRRLLALVLGGVAVLTAALRLHADEAHPPLPAAAQQMFAERVRPVFEKNCTSCHNPDQLKAGLDLTKLETLIKGSDSGPVFVPGSAKESLLFQLIQADGTPHMPPKKQLTGADIATLRNWIDGLPRTGVTER